MDGCLTVIINQRLDGQAEHELGWKATRNLDDMTRDLWRWQQGNPNGYK